MNIYVYMCIYIYIYIYSCTYSLQGTAQDFSRYRWSSRGQFGGWIALGCGFVMGPTCHVGKGPHKAGPMLKEC